MDFSRVQASGVSKLLLKGQQYSAPPNMQRIHVLDKWHFQEHRTCFLDATMFLLAKGGHIIDTVDYSHTESHGTRMVGAVSHSGDVMELHPGYSYHSMCGWLSLVSFLTLLACHSFHPFLMDAGMFEEAECCWHEGCCVSAGHVRILHWLVPEHNSVR